MNALDTFYREGQIAVVGITGRAGSGKTEFGNKFMQFASRIGIPVVNYPGDIHIKMSTKDRIAWTSEPLRDSDFTRYLTRIYPSSYIDWEDIARNLDSLKIREPVDIRDGYNQGTGEMDLDMRIEVPADSEGGLVLFDHYASGHVLEHLDGIVHLHVTRETARERSIERDRHKLTPQESLQRAAERMYLGDSKETKEEMMKGPDEEKNKEIYQESEENLKKIEEKSEDKPVDVEEVKD